MKDWGIVSVRPETKESVIDTLAKGDAINRVNIEEIGFVTVFFQKIFSGYTFGKNVDVNN